MSQNIELNITEAIINDNISEIDLPKLNLDKEIIEKKMKIWLEANENSDELEFERLARINLRRFQVFDNNEKMVIINTLMTSAFSKKRPVKNKIKKQIVPRRNIRNRTRLLKKPFQMKLF